MRNAITMSFADGTAQERALFAELRDGPESKAQRHAFFAEREANKVPGVTKDVKPRPVNRIAVLGAGTMGGGITMSFASAGIPVTIIDLNPEALERGMGIIEKNYRNTQRRGGLTEAQVDAALANITPSSDFDSVAEADMVIEAVFENMDLKKKIFKDLDAKCKPGCVLASNTSTLDVDEIAAVTSRPEDVVGMHFFSPANVMRLLEIVRGEKTAPDVLKTAMDVGKKGGKIPVVVGVCYGFVGNRMLHARGAQIEPMLLEGASPSEIDGALTKFGMAMGPLAMSDMAGLDVGYRIRQESGRKAPVNDAICEMGRFGQKTGKGWYLYEEGSRRPIPDPEIDALIARVAKEQGVTRRAFSEQEIFERLMFPMINEGAKTLEEGVALRASDIDVIYLYGYGFPVGQGGPMYYADQVGADYICERIHFFNNQNSTAPIFLVIDRCPGGSVMEGYRIVKAMEASRAPIHVVVRSFAASMAAVITTLADHSYAYPNALILHHQMSTGAMGNMTQIKEQYEQAKQWEARLMDPVCKKIGSTRDEFIKQMYANSSDGDWAEFADRAQKMRWVNEIVQEIREEGIVKRPEGAPPRPFYFIFMSDERKDDAGRPYRTLPRLGPFDFYMMHNPDRYWRMR